MRPKSPKWQTALPLWAKPPFARVRPTPSRPPRDPLAQPDAGQLITALKVLVIAMKTLTGDAFPVANEIARGLGCKTSSAWGPEGRRRADWQ